jgi:hypothetical protein
MRRRQPPEDINQVAFRVVKSSMEQDPGVKPDEDAEPATESSATEPGDPQGPTETAPSN